VKAIPTDHHPDIRVVNLHITYRCNKRCHQCFEMVDTAPSSSFMALETLESFIHESVTLKYPWRVIALHGGEPTLHPQFEQVCQMLSAYKKQHNAAVQLSLCTNGVGLHVERGIAVARYWGFEITNSSKSKKSQVSGHIAYTVSPSDLNEDYHLGCWQASACGLAFHEQGYYECSPAAAAYRVLGYRPPAKTLAQVTVERMEAGYNAHCKHCGFARKMVTAGDARAPQHSFKKWLFFVCLWFNSKPWAKSSKTWQKALDDYKRRGAESQHEQ